MAPMPAEEGRSVPVGRANLVTREGSGFVFFWHGPSAPSDEELEQGVAILTKMRSPVRVFVMTEGGAPSPSQQQRLFAALKGKQVVIAVVSDSVAIRFVASSFALFTRRIRIFASDALTEAYDHLELDWAQRGEASTFVEEATEASRTFRRVP